MGRTRSLVPAAMLCVLVAGCAQPYYARMLHNPLKQTSKVVLFNRGLRDTVSAAVMGKEQQEDGLLTGEVGIKNESDAPLTIVYRVIFKDSGGTVIDQSEWLPELLVQHRIKVLKIKATSPDVSDFVVLVKYAE